MYDRAPAPSDCSGWFGFGNCWLRQRRIVQPAHPPGPAWSRHFTHKAPLIRAFNVAEGGPVVRSYDQAHGWSVTNARERVYASPTPMPTDTPISVAHIRENWAVAGFRFPYVIRPKCYPLRLHLGASAPSAWYSNQPSLIASKYTIYGLVVVNSDTAAHWANFRVNRMQTSKAGR